MDRNREVAEAFWMQKVALRKESVDRNDRLNQAGVDDAESLSARRAWIEIRMTAT